MKWYKPLVSFRLTINNCIKLFWFVYFCMKNLAAMAVILILIAFPSFKLLYLMDEVNDSSMSVLAEGPGGHKPYILNVIVNTSYGQRKNNISLNEVTLNNCQCRRFFTE